MSYKKILNYFLFGISVLLVFFIVIGDTRLQEISEPITPIADNIKNKFNILNIKPVQIPHDYELTYDSVFRTKPDWLSDLPENKTITLIATGDVMLGRSVNTSTIESQNFNWAFLYTSDFLKNADITLINLEGTLIKNCPLTDMGMIFCGDAKHIEGLVNAGVDIVNLANNHSSNYGDAGNLETKNILNNAGILTTGLNAPLYKKVKNQTIAFLGYNSIPPNVDYISWAEEEKIISEIKLTKTKSDIVIVSFHWGDEYTEKPTNWQIKIGHLAIDSGADLVIGHHPHWTQSIEFYKGKPLLYSLGNFVFDQMWSQKTKEGMVAKITIFEDKLVDIELFPILIENYGQPKLC